MSDAGKMNTLGAAHSHQRIFSLHLTGDNPPIFIL
jgi:hypothetical protein